MHTHSGRILVDAVDLATVPSKERGVRNPLLIKGFSPGTQTDMELLAACHRVGLHDYLLANGGLDVEMSPLTLSPGLSSKGTIATEADLDPGRDEQC
ncbi:hypothetical protein FCULG_00012330 [Fusarium culmorum]|uniref:Uncharacterized protein n=1 Tax=Fusarium culmorum TaxID=5516 RepID=A0A2T4GRM9_FUSCU|nr:hypothetical protein FCULG_00012330 [Fusarium culmorum]